MIDLPIKPTKIIIIGSGFSSMVASCYLAKEGFDVTILEKNGHTGGRARQLKRDGFTFDMGPTFYWMPDVFERFFNDFGKSTSDYYELDKLNPAYKVYFEDSQSISIADDLEKIKATFEEIEKGAGKKLGKFIAKAEDNYNLAIKDLVYQPGQSILEITSWDTIKRLNLFLSNIKSEVAKYIRDKNLRTILEFPSLFLGATPADTPAFYSFMNFADFGLGTWHPKGGMYSVVEGIYDLAIELGVKFKLNASVDSIHTEKGNVTHVTVNNTKMSCDVLLSGADYVHTESLLPSKDRQYSDRYWDKRSFAPSALLFYAGFDTKLKNVEHHTLFFDTDFDAHAKTIYETGEWPDDPLFYASFPSITDPSTAPLDKETAIFLIPIAPNSKDTPELRELYFKKIISRLEKSTCQEVQKHLIFKESFCVKDFINDYNSYKGNGYGLANTLLQTHILRPKMKSKKVKNLYFTGQLTVPGPGVPPSIISGKIVSDLIFKNERTFRSN